MNVGKPKRVYRVEPLRTPVPEKNPAPVPVKVSAKAVSMPVG
jgi:hypothetical protein